MIRFFQNFCKPALIFRENAQVLSQTGWNKTWFAISNYKPASDHSYYGNIKCNIWRLGLAPSYRVVAAAVAGRKSILSRLSDLRSTSCSLPTPPPQSSHPRNIYIRQTLTTSATVHRKMVSKLTPEERVAQLEPLISKGDMSFKCFSVAIAT